MSLRRRVDQRAQMRAELYYISEILHCKMLLKNIPRDKNDFDKKKHKIKIKIQEKVI